MPVECANAPRGMGASLACAVRAITAAGGADAYVVALADMPFIRSSTIAAVRDALASGAPLAAPYFRAHRGHPVGISAQFRQELEALKGDEGARRIISANEKSLLKIPVGDPGVLRDIDTPGDLAPPLSYSRATQSSGNPMETVQPAQMSLKLIYRANIFVVNRARPILQMGRGDDNDIVVASLFASRLHARVEARDGQFVLTDLSSNGTFVLVDVESDEQSSAQSTEIRLREEASVLTGRGWLGLGRSAATHGEHSVRFALQAESA